MRVPNCVQNMQPSQWYDLTRSRPDESLYPPVYAVNGTNTVQQEQSSRHITRNTLLVPETERRYVAQDPTAFYSVNGNSNYPRNIPSSSHNGTLSDVHFTSAPSWVTEYDITTQYRQRMSGVFSHSMSASSGFVCGGQCGYCPVHLGASEAARDMELSIRGGNAIPFQVHLSSGFMINPERQAGGYPENPSALESIAIQRTSGLLSEVQNAMALFHRGDTLQREDVMVIEHTVLYGVPEEDGMNEDMHLDVDNMSYEELLNLGEDIGDVCTGLSHEAILANLRQRKYGSLTLGSPMEDEYCCICQEEYVDGDNLGILDCGHEFHFTCIIPWLVLKNSCPICKVKALAGCDGGD
ncbi:E3 ubiquitin ligase BIG BROTHER [Morella rubra]|uniref:RING-type E3 ubiquitin transferase n=1 Tax=Morella rubra TaxID=262757 RepID=A0A6A1VPE2_9ROSI|nr:E3 ubiquitin ligase BIG BROTHER [Morella rubra]